MVVVLRALRLLPPRLALFIQGDEFLKLLDPEGLLGCSRLRKLPNYEGYAENSSAPP